MKVQLRPHLIVTPICQGLRNENTILTELLWLLFKTQLIYNDFMMMMMLKIKRTTCPRLQNTFASILISKNIFIECWLSLIFAKPLRYFLHSSQSLTRIFSSKYFKLNKRLDSCCNLDTRTQKTTNKNTFFQY